MYYNTCTTKYTHAYIIVYLYFKQFRCILYHSGYIGLLHLHVQQVPFDLLVHQQVI